VSVYLATGLRSKGLCLKDLGHKTLIVIDEHATCTQEQTDEGLAEEERRSELGW
jgi:hypothetical protein